MALAKKISKRADQWLGQPLQWAELFALANLAFLAQDIFLAHSINHFAKPIEWAPLVFSIVASALLLLCMLANQNQPARRDTPLTKLAWIIGCLIGVGAIIVGVGGLLLHLESRFFEDVTVKNLVYTAPFAAPLAYAGLGLLILLDRLVDGTSQEWAGWIVLLSLGGFVGNFVLGLADHAQNAFWNPAEWVPVVTAALAVGFLSMLLLMPPTRTYLLHCFALMVLEIIVGVAGLVYHLIADLRGPADSHADNFIYGAPLFAPLLFANLALLERRAIARSVAAVPETTEDVAGGDGGERDAEGVV